MPIMTASRNVVGEDSQIVFASVKRRLFKQAKTVSEAYPGLQVKFAKEAGFHMTPEGRVTGSWFYSVE